MKTIIITTKESDNCYNNVQEAWFANCRFLRIHMELNSTTRGLQSEINTVRIKESNGFRACLPQCVNSQLPQEQKVNYVISLVCNIIKKLGAQKNDVYLVIHSGDLFDRQDSRRQTSKLLFDWLYCTTSLQKQLMELVEEKHMYQFRHDTNSISDLLLDSYDDDISSLCEQIIEIIETNN